MVSSDFIDKQDPHQAKSRFFRFYQCFFLLFLLVPGCDLYKPIKAPSIKTVPNEDGTYQVTLKAGSNAVIFYTTNGSAPTTNDEVYTGEFSIPAGTTVRAIALCPSGRKSTIENYTAN